MANYAFGGRCPSDCFIERQLHKSDRQTRDRLGDAVLLNGCEELKGIFTVEFLKINFGGAGTPTKETMFCYLTCDYPCPECGMTLQKGSAVYEVREVQEDYYPGWTCLKLKATCDVC